MPPPRPPPLVRLCPKHGIVAGPDGRCVICHRGDEEAKDRGGGLRGLGVLGLIVALAGGAVVWKVTSRRQAQVAAEVEAQRESAPTPPPPRQAGAEAPPARTQDEREAEIRDAVNQRKNRDVEAEMRRVPIRMFVDDKCDLCVTARDWLKKEGLRYSEVDVGADPSALEGLKKLTPTPTVPSFDVDGELVTGFGPAIVLGAVRRAADRRTR